MPVSEVKQDQTNQANQPLLNIVLPAPSAGDPREPLSVGKHNAAAQKNFERVANLIMAVINNQKMVSNIVAEQQKVIQELQQSNKALSDSLRKLLENEKSQDNG